ncbi:trace amine-associated receptor 13c-like [Salarias fasciatus]|uniref:Trace amine-associated receptor 13c-like n=1 Tax=Salarias fasciatus TaxID=181472 RepID=A0A672JD98_SALFA|nr:trace amine-associated receptor 13c-like [Salarias fasciatus]
MEQLDEGELCFPQLLNASCRRPAERRGAPDTVLYILLSSVSLSTVTLNLLVIISISHFRQLHTPTNLLLLSLAVSDFLVGLLLMPGRILRLDGCWYLGDVACGGFYFASFVLTSASVGNMVLVSIDRYVSICDPLSYPSRVTRTRVKVCICLCWTCSLVYNGAILHDFLRRPDRHNSCYGECNIRISAVSRVVDMALTFVGPILVIVALYLRVFGTAASQLRAIRSQIAAVTLQPAGLHVKRSSRKAATAVSVVVLVFLICFLPFFSATLIPSTSSASTAFYIFGIWLLYSNSLFNPLIYAFFYPWFRRCVKLTFSLQILQPGSSDTNIL